MSKQEDAWQQFADAVGGQMEYEENGWWIFKEREYRVTAPIGRWSLTLDTFTEMTSAVIAAGYASMRYVRMTVPYDGLPSPRFKLERAGFFGRLGRRAGTQKIETGDAEFDKYFTLWGGDAQQVRHLFASASLREAVREALPHRCVRRQRQSTVRTERGNDEERSTPDRSLQALQSPP